MDKGKQTILVASACGVLVILLIALAFVKTDKTGPVITVGNTSMTYVQSDDTDKLLEGVTAYDKKDGDVTDSLIVESVVVIDNEQKVRITYAACDAKKNVTKATKIVKYLKITDTNTPTDIDTPTE